MKATVKIEVEVEVEGSEEELDIRLNKIFETGAINMVYDIESNHDDISMSNVLIGTKLSGIDK